MSKTPQPIKATNMQPPDRDLSQKGLSWWSQLSAEERRFLIRELIDVYKMSNKEIVEYLELETIGRVASVRDWLKHHRDQLPPQPVQPDPKVVHRPDAPALTVYTNGTSPELPSITSREDKFVGLVLGTWRPQGKERPYMRLSPMRQRRLQPQASNLLNYCRRRQGRK